MGNVKARKRILRNPLKAIRAKCLECCGGSPKEVRLCSDAACALHPFRKGQNPFPQRKKSLSLAAQTANQAISPKNHPQGRGKPVPREIQLSLL